MKRLLCTLGCVAVTLLATPSALAEDAGDAEIDAGEDPEEDAGYDAGFDPGEDPEEDAGYDAGFDPGGDPEEDAGSPPDDAGTPGNDAGTPGNDAGTPGNDAGSPPVDGGTPGNDAGAPGNDAGTPGNDAGTPRNDAGTPRNDAGPPPHDAGLEPPDAGDPLPPFDAGRPGDECTPGCIDERRNGHCSSSGQRVPIPCAADESCEIDQCVPAALAGTTGCACRQGTPDTTIAFFALLLGVRLVRRRGRGRGEGALP